MQPLLPLRLLLLALLPLASCTVYAPLVPATPQVEAAGQTEIKAQASINRSLEASAAYSPLPHLSLLAAGGWIPDGRDTTFFRARQYELGAGYYTTLNQGQTYLSVLSGFGQASTVRGYRQYLEINSSPSIASDLIEYRSHYRKYFVQAHGWFRLSEPEAAVPFRLGGVLRSTWLDFRQLTINGQLADRPATHYVEYCLLGKVGKGPVQGQASVGFSVPSPRPPQTGTAPGSRTTVLISAAVVLYPHVFRVRQ